MLGGIDLNEALLAHVVGEFQRQEGINLWEVPSAQGRLEEAIEQAKCDLSFVRETSIDLPYITADPEGPKHLKTTITRAKFEQLGATVFDRLGGPCMQALSDSKLTSSDIDEVILVGASTRIPKVREIVEQAFGKKPNQSVSPDEVVALGAAIQGAILAGEVEEQMMLLDVTPVSLGVETLGGVMTCLIERNTSIPTEKTEMFSTTSDNQTQVTIPVLQGERERASDNILLGHVDLAGIPPAPRGIPQIEVAFSIDHNGILQVSARRMAKGEIKIHPLLRSLSSTAWDISACFRDGPYSLNPAQIKVLRQKVDNVLRSARQKKAQNRERLLSEAIRCEADALAGSIRDLSKRAECVPRERVSLLEAGANLIGEYIERGASGEDIDKLIASIRKIYQDTISASFRAVLGDLSTFSDLAGWAARAATSITTPSLLDDAFDAFQQIFAREAQIAGEFLNAEDPLVKRSVTEGLFQDPMDWTAEELVLAVIIGCCAGLEVPANGMAASQHHDMAKAALFLLLRASPFDAVRESAAKEIHSLQMNDCFFLLGYLQNKPKSRSDAWLVRCLHELPVGSWTSRFTNADVIETKELRDHPVALATIRRDAAALLRENRSGPWQTALGVLEEVGVGESAEILVPTLIEADHRTCQEDCIRLILLLASTSPCEGLIPAMLKLFSEGEEPVRQAVLKVLRRNFTILGEAVASIFADSSNVAEQLNVLHALRELDIAGCRDDIEALLRPDCHEDVLPVLIEVIADGVDEPAIISLLGVLAHSNSTVRSIALRVLRSNKERMLPPIRRVFTIAEKVLANGEKASFWERRFLAKLAKSRDDLAELVVLLRQRD